jgi:hypothetical protein
MVGRKGRSRPVSAAINACAAVPRDLMAAATE